jgi:hypothetical protein
MKRREFIGSSAAAWAAQSQDTPAKLRVRTSKEIAASPISIGFETLDREMFDPERTYDWIGKTGVKWARCQTGWGRTEKERGVYDFAWLDRVVDQLLARGIQPWFNVGYGNRLYTPEAPHPSAVGWTPFFDEAAMQAWLRYVARLAERFRGRVRHFEIWNEANSPGWWRPKAPDGKAYAQFLLATAPVIRAKTKDAYIVGCTLAGLGTTQKFVDDALSQGIWKECDAISFHPYRRRPEQNYPEDVAALRGLLAPYRKNIALWQGENGAPSQPGGFGALGDLAWTEETQAKWLLRRLLIDLKMGLELTSYFLAVDLANYVASGGVDGRTNYKGVLRATDYQPKQAYYALQNLCSLFDSETKLGGAALLRFDDPAIVQAGFERKGQAILAYWYSSNLPDRFAKRSVSAYLWGRFTRPMLVELMSGAVTPLVWKESGSGWTAPELPLDDAPILICDASVLL